MHDFTCQISTDPVVHHRWCSLERKGSCCFGSWCHRWRLHQWSLSPFVWGNIYFFFLILIRWVWSRWLMTYRIMMGANMVHMHVCVHVHTHTHPQCLLLGLSILAFEVPFCCDIHLKVSLFSGFSILFSLEIIFISSLTFLFYAWVLFGCVIAYLFCSRLRGNHRLAIIVIQNLVKLSFLFFIYFFFFF